MAYHQPTTPISGNGVGYLDAARAVDGNSNPDIEAGHCSLVVNDNFANDGLVWWEVDLEDHYVIKHVTIFHATDDPGRYRSQVWWCQRKLLTFSLDSCVFVIVMINSFQERKA